MEGTAQVGMTNTWIPESVGIVWAALFGLVVLVHLGHVVILRGPHRRWHVGHVLMAAGMIVMFAPTPGGMLVGPVVGTVVFVAAAGLLAVLLVIARCLGHRIGRLWLVSVIDLAWMAYMFAMMSSSRLAWLSVLGAVWFGAQAVGWAGGRLGRVLERGGLGEDGVAAVRPGLAVGTTILVNSGPPSTPPQSPTSAPGSSRRPAELGGRGSGTVQSELLAEGVVDGGRRDWSVRVTLTVMAVGMAYMLLAMRFGMVPMPGR